MRDIVRGLDGAAINWLPFEGQPAEPANSIAQLLSHALDGERFLIAMVAGVRLPRDRESHFRVRMDSVNDLVALIDASEQEIAGYVGRITFERLAGDVRIVEPTWPVPDVTQPGSYWLVHAIEQASEHIGQAMLTRQLYEAERSGSNHLPT